MVAITLVAIRQAILDFSCSNMILITEWPPFFFSDRDEGNIGLGKEIIELLP